MSRGKLVAYTWGYSGWGEATRELVRAFDDVERSRGRKPPVFADVRRSRSVRARGFQGGVFGAAAGKGRYHWFPGLGNERIITRAGALRLSRPRDVEKLLELVLAEAARGRRVVVFCSCPSPWDAAQCHRSLVGEKLLDAARARRLNLWLEEWPGGAVTRGSLCSLEVREGTVAALDAGRRWVALPRRPNPRVLGLPTGSIVKLVEGRQVRQVSVCAPRLVAGRWKLELFVRSAAESARAAALGREVKRKRAELFLAPRRF
jgi:hypothetical protein